MGAQPVYVGGFHVLSFGMPGVVLTTFNCVPLILTSYSIRFVPRPFWMLVFGVVKSRVLSRDGVFVPKK